MMPLSWMSLNGGRECASSPCTRTNDSAETTPRGFTAMNMLSFFMRSIWSGVTPSMCMNVQRRRLIGMSLLIDSTCCSCSSMFHGIVE